MASMTAAVRNFIVQQGGDLDAYDVEGAVRDLYVLHHDFREIDFWSFALIVWARETHDTARPPTREASAEGE